MGLATITSGNDRKYSISEEVAVTNYEMINLRKK
jgi:hypothetical protein